MNDILEIQSCDELIQMLNENEQFLHAAHVPDSGVNFEEKVRDLKEFRVTVLQKTEAFLHQWVPDLPSMHGICSQIDQEIEYALSICLSRSNRTESKKHTEADAYKFRFLLDYIAFLQDYNALTNRYLEYALGHAGVNPDIFKDGVEIGKKAQNSQVQGIPVIESRKFSQKVLKTEEEKEANTKKAYRIAIILLILKKGGWENFTATLTNEGKDKLYAEITGSSQRYFAGNKNNDDPKDYPWKEYAPDAEIFLDNLPRFKH